MPKMINLVLLWWLTPKLPYEYSHLHNSVGLATYIKQYLIHPIKRRVAKYYLLILRRFCGLKVIGITGSAGKTTTKDMLYLILKRKGRTLASYKNIDPIYNIPTTILKCTPLTRYLILEMGVEYPREMDFYLWLAKPDVGIITNIYPTHLQFFRSVEGVFKEKSKLVSSLDRNCWAVLNGKNRYLRKLKKKLSCKILWTGEKYGVYANNITYTDDMNTLFDLWIKRNNINVHLSTIGENNVDNALLASAVAFLLDCTLDDIKSGLESFRTEDHRMKIFRLKRGALVFDDSYNNNPEAAKTAIKNFLEVTGKRKKVLVFGDMLELGKDSKKYHRNIGRIITKTDIAIVIGVGENSKWMIAEVKRENKSKKAVWAADYKKALSCLKPLIKGNTAVLVKGSRSIGLDRLVSDLL